jgi:23S rRNA pseudouridine1911/1915/1917 synthase
MGPEQIDRTASALATHFDLTLPANHAGERLDQVLAQLLPDYSRNLLKGLIVAGRITVDEQTVKPRYLVRGGERVDGWLATVTTTADAPAPIPLAIVHEDAELLVINKPAGLVVHPGAGNVDRTLLNALLHHDPRLAQLPRAGIVHRLDKDTSGLLVVARTLIAHTALVRQLQARTVHREYQAVVRGVPVAGGTIDAPIGRHRLLRTRMAVIASGRPAVTHYRIAHRFRQHSLLQVQLETGRTHQIRVHLASLRYPLVGDPVYGGRLAFPPGASPALLETLRNFKRQALHACRLELLHPHDLTPCSYNAPMPADLCGLIEALTADAAQGSSDA